MMQPLTTLDLSGITVYLFHSTGSTIASPGGFRVLFSIYSCMNKSNSKPILISEGVIRSVVSEVLTSVASSSSFDVIKAGSIYWHGDNQDLPLSDRDYIYMAEDKGDALYYADEATGALDEEKFDVIQTGCVGGDELMVTKRGLSKLEIVSIEMA